MGRCLKLLSLLSFAFILLSAARLVVAFSFPSFETGPYLLEWLVFSLLVSTIGVFLWFPGLIIVAISSSSLLFYIPIALVVSVHAILLLARRYKYIYSIPLFFGVIGGIVACFLAKERGLKIKLLIFGMIVSSVIFVLLFPAFGFTPWVIAAL